MGSGGGAESNKGDGDGPHFCLYRISTLGAGASPPASFLGPLSSGVPHPRTHRPERPHLTGPRRGRTWEPPPHGHPLRPHLEGILPEAQAVRPVTEQAIGPWAGVRVGVGDALLHPFLVPHSQPDLKGLQAGRRDEEALQGWEVTGTRKPHLPQAQPTLEMTGGWQDRPTSHEATSWCQSTSTTCRSRKRLPGRRGHTATCRSSTPRGGSTNTPWGSVSPERKGEVLSSDRGARTPQPWPGSRSLSPGWLHPVGDHAKAAPSTVSTQESPGIVSLGPDQPHGPQQECGLSHIGQGNTM